MAGDARSNRLTATVTIVHLKHGLSAFEGNRLGVNRFNRATVSLSAGKLKGLKRKPIIGRAAIADMNRAVYNGRIQCSVCIGLLKVVRGENCREAMGWNQRL